MRFFAVNFNTGKGGGGPLVLPMDTMVPLRAIRSKFASQLSQIRLRGENGRTASQFRKTRPVGVLLNMMRVRVLSHSIKYCSNAHSICHLVHNFEDVFLTVQNNMVGAVLFRKLCLLRCRCCANDFRAKELADLRSRVEY